MRRGIFGSLLRDDTGAGGSLPWGLWSAPSATGIQINQATALQVATVMACVSILSEDVSKMKPRLFKEEPYLGYENGKRIYLRGNADPIAKLLRKPNGWQTWTEFCQMMMLGLVLRGNAFAVIVRNPDGSPNMLVPINPDRVRLWESPDGTLFWMVTRAGLHELAVLRSQPMLISYDDVLHLKGLSANGLVGLSRITVNREAVGLALAQEQQYARLMANGARPSGVLTTEQKLTPEAAARLRDDWATLNQGLINSGRTAILEAGLKWEQLTLSAVDLQFLQLRNFQVEEICRMFRVPPHMVASLTGYARANMSEQLQDYRNSTLMTYTDIWEERIAFTFDLDEKGIQVQFDESALTRADILTRYNSYRIGILTGFKKPNEVRVAEGDNADPDGETLLQPTNMAPMGSIPSDNPGNGKPGSDQTGKGEDGAGKPTEKVTTDNQPLRETLTGPQPIDALGVAEIVRDAITGMPAPQVNVTAHIHPGRTGEETLTIIRDGDGRMVGVKKDSPNGG